MTESKSKLLREENKSPGFSNSEEIAHIASDNNGSSYIGFTNNKIKKIILEKNLEKSSKVVTDIIDVDSNGIIFLNIN